MLFLHTLARNTWKKRTLFSILYVPIILYELHYNLGCSNKKISAMHVEINIYLIKIYSTHIILWKALQVIKTIVY